MSLGIIGLVRRLLRASNGLDGLVRQENGNYELPINLNGREIGNVHLRMNGLPKSANVGYWLDDGAVYDEGRRQELLGEALRRVLDFAFKELNLEEANTHICTASGCRGSLDFLEKIGFKLKDTKQRTGYRDLTYGLSREEYASAGHV